MKILQWKYDQIKGITLQAIKGIITKEEFKTKFAKLQNEIYLLENLK